MLSSTFNAAITTVSQKTDDSENYLKFCETEFSVAVSVKLPHKSFGLKITMKEHLKIQRLFGTFSKLHPFL